MNRRAAARWIGLALLGLAIAVAVGVAAANLFSTQIGIADQPIRAGEELAPRIAPPTRKAPPTPEPTPPSETPPSDGDGDHDD